MPHIGEIIKQVKQEKGKRDKDIASALNITRSSVQDLYKRQYARTDDLEKLSRLFNYNFFKHFQTHEESSVEGTPYVIGADIPHSVHEDELIYKKRPYVRKITVLVELDGTEETYKNQIEMLSNINKVIT